MTFINHFLLADKLTLIQDMAIIFCIDALILINSIDTALLTACGERKNQSRAHPSPCWSGRLAVYSKVQVFSTMYRMRLIFLHIPFGLQHNVMRAACCYCVSVAIFFTWTTQLHAGEKKIAPIGVHSYMLGRSTFRQSAMCVKRLQHSVWKVVRNYAHCVNAPNAQNVLFLCWEIG